MRIRDNSEQGRTARPQWMFASAKRNSLSYEELNKVEHLKTCHGSDESKDVEALHDQLKKD